MNEPDANRVTKHLAKRLSFNELSGDDTYPATLRDNAPDEVKKAYEEYIKNYEGDDGWIIEL